MRHCGSFFPLTGLLVASAISAAPADDNFASRCNAPGVIKCIGFDDTNEVVRGENLLPIYGSNEFGGSVDTSVRASGAGSLRFDIPENVNRADVAGKFVTSLGADFGARNLARFNGNNSVYIQFRQRFTQPFESGQLSRIHFKQAAINNTDKCGDESIVTENSMGRRFPQLYANCGSTHFIKKVDGMDIIQSNGTGSSQLYWCTYADQRAGNYSRCATYKADQWITFYYELELGDEDQPNSSMKAYIGYEGEPMRQFIDFHGYEADFDRSNGERQAFRSISLLPYITRKTAAEPNEAASTWYDELVISRAPIPAPDSNSGGPRPNPPTSVSAR